MLQVRGLTKSYGRRRVVVDVDLDVGPGEIVALVGENGAGKSTVVRCIAGVLAPDRGEVHVAGGHRPAVVWQDLALCDNLDTVANVFLGAERGGRLLDDAAMRHETRRLLADIGAQIDDLTAPVGYLSGGQRQMVAVARALQTGSPVLVLDEPTAALGVTETRSLEDLLRRLRERGLAMLMVSHRIDQVFALADRILVMRLGEVVANVSPIEVHPDDVIALMSGTPSDSTARRQLHQLRRLVDQLAEVEPGASMPLIISSLSRSLSTEALGIWLATAGDDAERVLTLRADTGLTRPARDRLHTVALGSGVIGAAMRGTAVVLEDASLDPEVGGIATSAWSVPIPGNDGPIGAIAGFAPRVGRPALEQIELAELHANLVAVALEREELVTELTRRNRLLESLRGLLDRLAGPEPVASGIGVAMVPLCEAIGADAVALYEEVDDVLVQRAAIDACGEALDGTDEDFDDAAAAAVTSSGTVHRAQLLGAGRAAVLVGETGRRALLVARWRDGAAMDPSAVDLLEDAARSLALALEREAVETAIQESRTLRRANAIQREFLHRLSHELRTPLTAIRGYAESLRQPDIEWDLDVHDRFLERIAAESARMGRLVRDLLDSSAIEHDQLRLQPDWCDLAAVVDEAVGCLPGDGSGIDVRAADDLPVVWADHDRIEQVIVNLLENAVRHGAPPVTVAVEVVAGGREVEVAVSDGGSGFPSGLGDSVFDPHVAGGTSSGAGLGLAIARGIAHAHGGSLAVDGTTGGGSRVVLRLPVEPSGGATSTTAVDDDARAVEPVT